AGVTGATVGDGFGDGFGDGLGDGSGFDDFAIWSLVFLISVLLLLLAASLSLSGFAAREPPGVLTVVAPDVLSDVLPDVFPDVLTDVAPAGLPVSGRVSGWTSWRRTFGSVSGPSLCEVWSRL